MESRGRTLQAKGPAWETTLRWEGAGCMLTGVAAEEKEAKHETKKKGRAPKVPLNLILL